MKNKINTLSIADVFFRDAKKKKHRAILRPTFLGPGEFTRPELKSESWLLRWWALSLHSGQDSKTTPKGHRDTEKTAELVVRECDRQNGRNIQGKGFYLYNIYITNCPDKQVFSRKNPQVQIEQACTSARLTASFW